MISRITMYDEDPESWEEADGALGSLVADKGGLPLKALEVRATVSGLVSEVAVRQTFINEADDFLEATYIFPLPARAAVTHFRMMVAGRVVEAQLKERSAAQQEYQAAILKGHRSALAEQQQPGVFSLRVGNLPARETVEIELTLVMPLNVSAGTAEFRFPLVVAPRYAGNNQALDPQGDNGTPVSTRHDSDQSYIHPPVMLPGCPNPVRLALEVDVDAIDVITSEEPLQAMRCSLHNSVTTLGARSYRVRLLPGERHNRDFILRFPVAAEHLKTTLQASASQPADHPGVFALTLVPPQQATPSNEDSRDVVFVLDRSGSMGGWKMIAARRAVGRMVDALGDQDQFAVLAFDDQLMWSCDRDSLLTANNRLRWQALEWIGKIESRGGTEMEPAIDAAVRTLVQGVPNRRRLIVLITDGQFRGEDRVLRRLQARDAADIEVFTVGIDRAVNETFLTRLARQNRGQCELVESEGRLDDAMGSIHRLMSRPVLTNIYLEPIGFDCLVSSISPRPLPGLFEFRPLTIYGRYRAGASEIRLRVHAVDAEGNPWSCEVGSQPQSHELLVNLWGRSRVRELEDQYVVVAQDRAVAEQLSGLQQQIEATSLESKVVSRFTALVAVDSTETVNPGGINLEQIQPVEFPDGWVPTQLSEIQSLKYAPMQLMHSSDRHHTWSSNEKSFRRLSKANLLAPASRSVSTRSLVSQLVAEVINFRAMESRIERRNGEFILRHLSQGKFVGGRMLGRQEVEPLLEEIRIGARLPAATDNSDVQEFRFEVEVDSISYAVSGQWFRNHEIIVIAVAVVALKPSPPSVDNS